ncbi:MAG: ABC transporter permease [Candidatus Aminicenantes bacterium]|nr:ABC transporter permease [Candidatus Aminicenantes bacterium]
MFDRKRAIEAWKKRMRTKQAIDDGDLVELEGYLRDKMDDLLDRGLSEEEAFHAAEAEFQDSEQLDEDYYRACSPKANTRPPWKPPRFVPALAWDYLRAASRRFKRKKFFSLVNITGMAVGLACCLVILLYVDNESSYDRYHRDANRIYRILEYRKVPAGEFCMAGISPMMAEVLRSDFGQVEKAARIFPVQNVLFGVDNRRSFEDRVVYTESDIFRILTIPFLKGNPDTALDMDTGIVLSSRIAKKYFGDEEPLGRRIAVKDPVFNRLARTNRAEDYIVTGVVADPPSNTHFKYGFFMPLSKFRNTWLLKEWHAGATLTYVKLASGVSADAFDKKIERLAYDYVSKELTSWGQTRRYFLQPISAVHFQRDYKGLPVRDELEPPGNPVFFVIYGFLAVLVLLIGCMNFINLSNARGVERIKEVGLRKVVGASRGQLILQLLGETFFITFTAAVCAILLTCILLPLFNQFAQTTLTMHKMLDLRVGVLALGLVFVVGLLSGIYPAFVLTGFRPDDILRGKQSGTREAFALKMLVVGQFTISIFLATGAIAASRQLAFLRSGDLGFVKEHKFIIPMHRSHKVRTSVKTVKAEFLRNPRVLGVTASSGVPGRPLREGYLSWTDDKLDKPIRLDFLSCNEDFLPQYKIDVVAGRGFDESLNDEDKAFLINEAAVSHLGYASPEEALGGRLHESWYGKFKTIVGVIKNVHFLGLEKEVKPMFLEVSSSRYDMLTLTLDLHEITKTLGFIESTWTGLFPEIPFDGYFLDDAFDSIYRKEAQMGKMLSILTGMGLVVACLGLLGLASFMVKHRTKEIGIRKVLGARVSGLVGLLSRRFMVLVVLANVFSVPPALLAINRWLQGFAFRVGPEWEIFVLAGGAAFVCALFPVFIQSFRAARANPVDSLRYE